jgi:hypothetical protein
MLSYALAIAVALSSLVLFSTAFVMSDIHRQDDFLWSGVGLFYALVLWFCARNITGAVLLGQAAAASLLVSYNWQTLQLRKAIAKRGLGPIAHPNKASATNNFSILQAVNGLLKRNQPQPQVNTSSTTTTSDKVTEENIAIPEQSSNPTKSQESNNQPPSSPTSNKSKGLGKLFANKKQPSLTNTKLDEVLDEEVTEKTKTNTVPTPAIEENKTEQETVEKIATNQAEEKVSNIPESQSEAKSTVDQSQSEETISDQQDEQYSSPENSLESKPKTTTFNSENSPVKPSDNQPEQTNLSDINNESTSEAISPEITAQTPTTQSEKKSSPLDSLETVEVAEILEASPEERFGNRASEPIIEVTTTEIKITIEEKTDQNKTPDSDSEPPQQS